MVLPTNDQNKNFGRVEYNSRKIAVETVYSPYIKARVVCVLRERETERFPDCFLPKIPCLSQGNLSSTIRDPRIKLFKLEPLMLSFHSFP